MSEYVKQLVVIGDSFCHGIGTVATFKDKRNTEYAFGKYIADKMNLEYVNLAEPGSDVQRAIQVGYSYIQENKQDIEKVIIGWTSGTRVGFYDSENSDNVLQILPEFCYLGNITSDDIFFQSSKGVKYIADKDHKDDLQILEPLQRIFITENFFQYAKDYAAISAVLFKNWLDTEKINYTDFRCFGNIDIETKCPITFCNVWNFSNEHPSKEEQKLMSVLLMEYV